jgi:HAD superfamily hydrolase (TIGR01490 family)
VINISKDTSSLYYAFFDLDETLISIKSMFSFLKFYCKRHKNNYLFKSVYFYFIYIYKLKFLSYLGKPREYINLTYYKFFRGIDKKLLKHACEEWFRQNLEKNNCFFNINVLSLLEMHKKNGGIPVLVSGSFIECIKPIAKFCGVQHSLAIKLEKDANNKCTGNILQPQTIGSGKMIAIKEFLDKNKFYDYDRCFAYGDHISDKPMLDLVGNPCAVIHSKNKSFEDYARTLGWNIIKTS